MIDFLVAAATCILATIALGVLIIARRPGSIDLIMAIQLLGTGGGAVLLLFTVAAQTPSIIDVAFMFALLAAFAAVAFVRAASAAGHGKDSTDGSRA